jgi:hypothetical protein
MLASRTQDRNYFCVCLAEKVVGIIAGKLCPNQHPNTICAVLLVQSHLSRF